MTRVLQRGRELQARGRLHLGYGGRRPRLGEVPNVAFRIDRAIGSIAIELVVRLLSDARAGRPRPLAVRIDLPGQVDANELGAAALDIQRAHHPRIADDLAGELRIDADRPAMEA